MNTHRLVIIALMLSACAHAPIFRSTSRGLRTPQTVRDVPVRGFEVVLVTLAGETDGELLAIDAENVWVEVKATPTQVRRTEIKSLLVRLPDHAHWSWGAGYALAGALSTVTHGLVAIYTAPLWATVGVIGSLLIVGDSRVKRDVTVPASLDALGPFARFPQGLPPGYVAAADGTGRAPSPVQSTTETEGPQ